MLALGGSPGALGRCLPLAAGTAGPSRPTSRSRAPSTTCRTSRSGRSASVQAPSSPSTACCWALGSSSLARCWSWSASPAGPASPATASEATVVPIERCAECGFDGGQWSDADALAAVAQLPARWRESVDALDAASAQRRPISSMWSIAEYTDHVREVIFGMRFVLDVALADPGADLGESPEARFESSLAPSTSRLPSRASSARSASCATASGRSAPSSGSALRSSAATTSTRTGSSAMRCTT